VRYDDFLKAWMITAESVQSVDDAIESHAKRLTIRIDGNAAGRELVNRLSETLRPFTRGSCEVCVQYQSRQASALLTLGDDWSVRATRELREELAQLVGEDRVSIHYPRHFAH
jgi:DNA polymerase-3 subunit alpha